MDQAYFDSMGRCRTPPWQTHTYTVWTFRDGVDEFGPVRGFDVPFNEVGDWDSSAIPPPDGELNRLETSLAQSGLHLVSAVPIES